MFMKCWVASLLMVCGIAFVSGAAARDERPKVIRIHVMNVEMREVEYTAMMRRGEGKGSDYEVAMGLVSSGKARIQDVNVVSGRAGEKFTLESVREEIYGSEYEPPGLPPVAGEKPFDPAELFPWMYRRPFMAALGRAFETRNAGMTLEVEPTFSDDGGGIVDLRFAPEFVARRGFSVWVEHEDRWGRSDVKFPSCDTYRVNTGLTLLKGEFALSHLFTPKGEDGELDGERKILVFVMAEVVAVEK